MIQKKMSKAIAFIFAVFVFGTALSSAQPEIPKYLHYYVSQRLDGYNTFVISKDNVILDNEHVNVEFLSERKRDNLNDHLPLSTDKFTISYGKKGFIRRYWISLYDEDFDGKVDRIAAGGRGQPTSSHERSEPQMKKVFEKADKLYARFYQELRVHDVLLKIRYAAPTAKDPFEDAKKK